MDVRVLLARGAIPFTLALVLGCRAETAPPLEAESAPPSLGAVETPPARPAAAAPAIDIPNARTPVAGILVGGQPTVEQIRESARLGYRTVVNLRLPMEGAVARMHRGSRGQRQRQPL